MTFRTTFLILTGALSFACNSIEAEPEEGAAEEPIVDGDCDVEGDTAKCEDGDGIATCMADADGNLTWSECAISECSAGDSEPCGNNGIRQCVVDDAGVGTWGDCQASGSSVTTPLVLAFESGPVTFTAAAGAFSIDPMMSVTTDWVSARTPWLALDHNDNGVIDDGSELFGSASVLASGRLASNGFLALAELDADKDGVVSAADPAFARLSAWIDLDQDRVTDSGELVRVSELGVESIAVRYDVVTRCDARDNCEKETGALTFRSASGELRSGRVIDVHLSHR